MRLPKFPTAFLTAEQLRIDSYNTWLAAELQASIDDPRPNIPFDVAMAEMDRQLADLKASSNKKP